MDGSISDAGIFVEKRCGMEVAIDKWRNTAVWDVGNLFLGVFLFLSP